MTGWQLACVSAINYRQTVWSGLYPGNRLNVACLQPAVSGGGGIDIAAGSVFLSFAVAHGGNTGGVGIFLHSPETHHPEKSAHGGGVAVLGFGAAGWLEGSPAGQFWVDALLILPGVLVVWGIF